MQSVDAFMLILVLSGTLTVGFVTYFNDRRSVTNKLLLLFTLVLCVYGVVNYLTLHQTTDSDTYAWVKVLMSLVPYLNLLYYLLVVSFPEKKLTIKSSVLWIYLVSTTAVSALSLFGFVFTSVTSRGENYVSAPGVGMLFFLVHTGYFLGKGFAVLLKKYKTSTGIAKIQLKYFLIGTMLMYGLILLANFILVLLFNITVFINYLPVYVSIFVVIVSYAIVKFGLFDVRVILTEVAAVILWVVLFSKIFASQGLGELFVDFFVFVVVVIFGIILIKSVRREVDQRRQLEELTTKLKALDKQKDEFISMAAHELRAPMTAIRGYVSMLLDGDAGELSQTAREYLTDANSVTERLVRLVNNMLNVGRIEEGRMVFKQEIVKVSDIVRHVFISFKFEAQRKNLKFGINVEEGLKDMVYVDSDKLTEVIGNLVSNSVKYTEKGSIDINIKQKSPNKVRVEVVDTGPGISPAEQQKLFQKFYRVESKVGKTIGTGLGLYISRLLIGKFGGEIGLISESGKGSNFWFELPVVNENYQPPKEFETVNQSANIKS